jgi:hypothetical protein
MLGGSDRTRAAGIVHPPLHREITSHHRAERFTDDTALFHLKSRGIGRNEPTIAHNHGWSAKLLGSSMDLVEIILHKDK